MSTLTTDQEIRDTKLPKGFGLISIPDATGDTRQIWDPRNKDEVAVAKAAFDDARKRGMTAYLVGEDGETGEVVTSFPKKAGKMIMVRQIQGG